MKQARNAVWLIASLSSISVTLAQETSVEAERIERAFLAADDLVIVNRIEDLPGDVIERFDSIAEWESMANWGEHWNAGDVSFPGVKDRQHVFSAISEKIAAVVFQQDGFNGGSAILLVAERESSGICRYFLGQEIPHSVSAIREAMGSPTFRWYGKLVTCTYESLR